MINVFINYERLYNLLSIEARLVCMKRCKTLTITYFSIKIISIFSTKPINQQSISYAIKNSHLKTQKHEALVTLANRCSLHF